jgi:hypothetical protein
MAGPVWRILYVAFIRIILDLCCDEFGKVGEILDDESAGKREKHPVLLQPFSALRCYVYHRV